MQKKIIAVSATHGCGKTTMVYGLARHLKKLGKNVVVLNELARECPFKINQHGENRTQVWLITEQIKRELELMDRYDYIICDRSVFDAYAYATYLNKPDWTFRNLWPYMTAHVEEYYQNIFLLNPREFNFNIGDGVRDTDEKFRTGVHLILHKLLDASGFGYTYTDNEEEVFSQYK